MIDLYPHDDPCDRCKATAWESIGEFRETRGRPQEVLECAFCGMRLRVTAKARKPRALPIAEVDEFRFQFGRFTGMTFAEADAEPNGRRYLEHLRDTNDKLRDRITEYLTTAASSA